MASCGKDAYPKAVVTGRVTCGDKPAWGGVITFQPLDVPDKTGRPAGNPGGVSRAIVQEDGTYRLEYEARGAGRPEDGAIIGPHRVTFTPPMTAPIKWSAQDDWLPEEDKAKLKEKIASEKVYPKLACGIELDRTEVEVQNGENTFDFQLQGTPKSERPQPTRQIGSD